MTYFVYILASRPHGAIYVGSARDLRQRVEQHRSGVVPGHTAKYKIYRLVHFELYTRPEDAIARERRIKRWRREWKDALIAETNPDWKDVSAEIPF